MQLTVLATWIDTLRQVVEECVIKPATGERARELLRIDARADMQAIVQLVRQWGLVSDNEIPQCSVLGGGVSNLVIKIQTNKGAVVVKQALGQLRVRDEWLADRFDDKFYDDRSKVAILPTGMNSKARALHLGSATLSADESLGTHDRAPLQEV